MRAPRRSWTTCAAVFRASSTSSTQRSSSRPRIVCRARMPRTRDGRELALSHPVSRFEICDDILMLARPRPIKGCPVMYLIPCGQVRTGLDQMAHALQVAPVRDEMQLARRPRRALDGALELGAVMH